MPTLQWFTMNNERNCPYCLKKLERKEYPSGQYEHDRRFYARKYCNVQCYSKHSEFINTKNKFIVLKNERQKCMA